MIEGQFLQSNGKTYQNNISRTYDYIGPISLFNLLTFVSSKPLQESPDYKHYIFQDLALRGTPLHLETFSHLSVIHTIY